MSTVAVALFLVLLSILIYKYWTGKRPKRNYAPGPPRLPFIGSYLHLLWLDFKRPYVALIKMKDFYQSPVISFGLGHYDAVAVNDYDTCKEFFNNPDVQGRVPAYPALVRTFGEKHGFFNDDGERWLQMRRSALRALRDFGFGRRSDNFEAIVEEEVQNLVEFLNSTNGESTLVPQALYHTLLNLITQILHGFRISQEQRNVLTDLGKNAVRIITSTDSTGRMIAFWPWMRFLFPVSSGAKELKESSAHLEEFVKNSYKNHLTDFDDEALRDLMDYYIKYKEQLPDCTDEEIWASVMDLTFPNTAVSVTLTFTLAYLAEQPHIMKKCQKQIDDFVGRGRLPNLDDRQNLTMVESSIRETLRINPLAPLGIAHRATVDTTLGGYDIPEGSLVLANLYAMNHDSRAWKDPEVFRPERFTEDGAKDLTFPFGLGKRVCAAETFARQNLFVVTAAILQNFDLQLSTPLDPEKFIYGVAVTPPPDFAMRFIPRP